MNDTNETTRVHHPTLRGRFLDVPTRDLEKHTKQGWKTQPPMPNRAGQEPSVVGQSEEGTDPVIFDATEGGEPEVNESQTRLDFG